MVSYLRPIKCDGLQAEAAEIDKLLLEGVPEAELEDQILLRHGRKEGEPENKGLFPTIPILAELRIRELLKKPRSRGYPPRVFVSYRRTGTEAINRASTIANALRNAGYHVLFDEFQENLDEWRNLGRFYGNIAQADLCVVIVSKGYVGNDSVVRDWIFEEINRIRRLHSFGLVELVYVVDNDYCVDQTVYPLDWNESGIGIIREKDFDSSVNALLEMLGSYTGKILSENEERFFNEKISECLAYIAQGEKRQAANILALLTSKFGGTEEVELLSVELFYALGENQQAVEIAKNTLSLNPSPTTAFELAVALWRSDEYVASFTVFSELVFRPSARRVDIIWYMADILRRLGAYHSAANYYRLLLSDSTGIRLLGAENLQVQARAYLIYTLTLIGVCDEELLNNLFIKLCEHDPAELLQLPYSIDAIKDMINSYSSGRGELDKPIEEKLCPSCTARYPLDSVVCINCGAVFPGHIGSFADCGLCGSKSSTLKAEIPLPACPTCHKLHIPANRFEEEWPEGLLVGNVISIDGFQHRNDYWLNLSPSMKGHAEFLAPKYASRSLVDGRWWNRWLFE